jgi:hypothetical protein
VVLEFEALITVFLELWDMVGTFSMSQGKDVGDAGLWDQQTESQSHGL